MSAAVTCPFGRPFAQVNRTVETALLQAFATPVVARTVSPSSTSFRFLSASRPLTHPSLPLGCGRLDCSIPLARSSVFSSFRSSLRTSGVALTMWCPVGFVRIAVLPPPPPHFTVRTGDRKGVRS
jgi:hypothetical protein